MLFTKASRPSNSLQHMNGGLQLAYMQILRITLT
jgi:hypothetical protein